MPEINPAVLLQHLSNAMIPVASVDCEGRILYTRDLTASEKSAADAIIAAHEPVSFTMTPDTAFIKSNGVHAAMLVFYADAPPQASLPDTITALVNEVAVTVPVPGGVGQLEITSDTPGAVIEVTLQDSPLEQCYIYAL